MRSSFVWNSGHSRCRRVLLLRLLSTFVENAFGTVIMSYILQGRLPSHTPHEHGYSHGYCWLDCFISAMDTVGWIVLFALSKLEQHVIFVSSNPKITVICFSSWLLCCRKKRQHRLLPPLHLGNCTHEKKSQCCHADTFTSVHTSWLFTRAFCQKMLLLRSSKGIYNSHLFMYFFSSVSVYLFPQKDHIAITLVKQNCLLIKIIWNTKKYPAQMLKVAGDLRWPLAKFENPVNKRFITRLKLFRRKTQMIDCKDTINFKHAIFI